MPKDGWRIDCLDKVVQSLQLVRFFNRFDKATLYHMLQKTDLRTVMKHQLLFLEPQHCAIVINGNLSLFSHKDDVNTPILQAIYTPGDIIGNEKIDSGWSRDKHSWIMAYKDCDILLINKEYIDYLWDKMKRTCEQTLGCLIGKLKEQRWFSRVSEQGLYTLCYDMIKLRKYTPGDMICE